MAYARITTTFSDGTSISVEVGAVGAHPDLLDELVTRTRALNAEQQPDET